MDILDTFLKCINLSKTICEAFGYLEKGTRSGKDFDPILVDVSDGLKILISKAPTLLKENQTNFCLRTKELLAACSKAKKLATNKEQLFLAFNSWNRARIEILYIEAINASFRFRNQEESAIALLESIIEDKTAASIEPIADFMLSRVIGKQQPLRAYQLGIKAFELNHELGKNIAPKGSPIYNYVYNRAEEVFFDRCPICHGTGAPYYCASQVWAINYDTMFSPMKLWMKCGSCGQLYTYNFPKKLAEPQPESEELGDETYMQPKLGLLSLFGNILKKAASYTKGKTLLDVGVGSGELVAAALELGFDAEGIEISKRQAQRLKTLLNIEIHCTDFLNFSTSKRYDIITMGDVIEHIINPAAAIKKANELLAENGVLWISTPNYESGFSRITGFDDPMWLEPYHVTYFCFNGFRKLLSENGFEVLDYSISNRYNGSMELIAKKLG